MDTVEIGKSVNIKRTDGKYDAMEASASNNGAQRHQVFFFMYVLCSSITLKETWPAASNSGSGMFRLHSV